MEEPTTSVAMRPAVWLSEEFICNSVLNYLKENGYKILKPANLGSFDKPGRVITATRFFKKEVIEVKGFPHSSLPFTPHTSKSTSAKSWFTEALFNSFVNFSILDNADVAIALPNVGRYQAIIQKLNDYFSVNDLYFKIYLVNEDGSVDVSNLNIKYHKQSSTTVTV